ncbi:S-layer homology domain-containing protein [Paenibacillus sp. L3-i20]|uniref:S-layer homology domain-containing protein n=1 Tax=Paenibacillus sp. L3-i20 TaxID=2905833 RepID=UPI001EDF6579|nr:S-layer homology domain-containing protein [Paenibacillus sp. L3-i20]GKU78834.1 hypothetical protein L3i20_v232310 [Paenibacillus sp. L3-i20]
MNKKLFSIIVFCVLGSAITVAYLMNSNVNEHRSTENELSRNSYNSNETVLQKQSLKMNGPADLSGVLIETHFTDIDRKQINKLQFVAFQGPILITLSNIMITNAIRLTIVDPANGEEIVKIEQSEVYERKFTLPRTGTYDLYMEYVFNGDRGKTDPVHVTIKAKSLLFTEMDPPWVALRRFETFETIEEPFDLGIRSLNGQAEDVKVYLDDQFVGNGMLNEPFIINPSNLNDGFHHITVVVKKDKTSNNETKLIRDFVVDRFDTFLDVPKSHWGHHPIEVMNHLGIVEGPGNQRFKPDASMTRQEFAKLLAITLGLEVSDKPTRYYDDISPESWSKPYIDALTNAGLIKGEEKEGKWYFHPERTINRAEAVTILGRTPLFADVPIYNYDAPYPDHLDMPDWAVFSIMRLKNAGWISGYSDGTFRSKKTLSRAEASKLVIQFLIP